MIETKQKEFIDFFAELLHQGGAPYAPYALRARLTDVAKDAGHTVGATGVHGTMHFTVAGDKLIIKEEMHLDKMLLNSNDKYKVEVLTAEENSHLLSGTAVYSIDLTAEKPSVECVDLVLNHHNDRTTNIFDTRTVFAKIVDFLKAVVGMNKLVDPVENNPPKLPGMK